MKIDLPTGNSVDLSILPLEYLKPHEQIIPSLLDALYTDMQQTGTQRDPVLVDGKTGLILDGMHRRAALEKIGAKLAVCSSFDYDGASVKLERWLRTFSLDNRAAIDTLVELFQLQRSSSSEAVQAVDSGASPLALISAKDSYVSMEKVDLIAIYSKLSEFDQYAASRGIKLHFQEEVNVDSKDGSFLIYPMMIAKKDVKNFVESNKVFPYKTTRHTVLIRPLNVCFPLDLLKEGNKEKCEKQLYEIVISSTPIVLQPKTPYNGRMYSEPIAVIVS
jgi:L-serine kinase (ADP)